METETCVICHNDLPEGRRLTCSHDCYLVLKFDKRYRKHVSKGVCRNCGGPTIQARWVRPGAYSGLPQHVPAFCSLECKAVHVDKHRKVAAKVLGRFK